MDKTPVNLLQYGLFMLKRGRVDPFSLRDTRSVLLKYLILVVYCSSAFVAVATCYYQMMLTSDLNSFVENLKGAAGFSQVNKIML